MKFKHFFTIILLFGTFICFGQNRVMDFGIEVQAYPTGVIPGLRFEKSFNKRDLWSVRVGSQIFDHGDKGEHGSEKGFGWGGTAGYKHYFNRYFRGPSLSARVDYWRNSVDWESKNQQGDLIKGNSEIQVIQPTVELGWAFLVGENMVITPTAAFGFEINVKTVGEKTGEGAILLVGLNAAYRIQ